jgi:nicotinamide mononucleotide transporter
MIYDWLTNNYIEVFGAVTGIIYVLLEIRQTIWLWPVGIITSAVYIWVFFAGKLYADMSLQSYYLAVSILGWYWWMKGSGHRAQGAAKNASQDSPFEVGKGDVKHSAEQHLVVSHLTLKIGIVLMALFILLYAGLFFVLSRFTDSPVPAADSFITSLSIIATWMLARKILEHWYLWIIVNTAASVLFTTRGLYPTVVLYIIYGIMSFVGLRAWRKGMVVSESL